MWLQMGFGLVIGFIGLWHFIITSNNISSWLYTVCNSLWHALRTFNSPNLHKCSPVSASNGRHSLSSEFLDCLPGNQISTLTFSLWTEYATIKNEVSSQAELHLQSTELELLSKFKFKFKLNCVRQSVGLFVSVSCPFWSCWSDVTFL
jgi:hypothetical protein